MSARDQLPELRSVLVELGLLRERVAILEEQVVELQAAQSLPVSAAPVSVNYSFAGPAISAPYPASEAANPRADRVTSLSGSSQDTELRVNTAGFYSDEYRSGVAIEAGKFVRRCLDGAHRGESGREKIKLQSRLYLVFRDFRGTIYNPVRVCNTFSECKALVKPDGHCGDSIFLGWPTQWEAKLCAREAGVAWPPADAGGYGRR